MPARIGGRNPSSGGTRCDRTDDAGAFSFLEVPVGSYYVLCLARWKAPSGEARQQMLVQVDVGEEEVRAVDPFESHAAQ